MFSFLAPYKTYLYGFLIVGAIFALIAYGYFMFDAGRNSILSNQAELLKEKDRKIVKLQQELENETGKVRTVYRDRIQTIRGAADPSGCADTDLPPEFLQQLEPE